MEVHINMGEDADAGDPELSSSHWARGALLDRRLRQWCSASGVAVEVWRGKLGDAFADWALAIGVCRQV